MIPSLGNVDGKDIKELTNQIAKQNKEIQFMFEGNIDADNIRANSITADLITAGAITTAAIADGSISTAKLADGAITGVKIADAVVSNAKLIDNTIQGIKLQAGTLTDAQLADYAVTSAKIASAAITSSLLADLAVTGQKIANTTISGNKIMTGTITANNIAANTITGNEIAANTITAGKLSVSTLSAITADLGSITAGSISGTTITGGTIRTSASGPRLQMSSDSFNVYDNSGSRLSINAYTATTSSGASVDFQTAGSTVASLYTSGSDFKLDTTSMNIRILPGGTGSLYIPFSNTLNSVGGSSLTSTFAALSHTHSWSAITSGLPTTLSGYGITDGVNTSDVVTTATANKILKLNGSAQLPASITGNAATATNVSWSGITSKPTTLSGYSITDGATKGFATGGPSSTTTGGSHNHGLTDNHEIYMRNPSTGTAYWATYQTYGGFTVPTSTHTHTQN